MPNVLTFNPLSGEFDLVPGGFDAASVIFADADGNLAGDSTNLVWDFANLALGIRTSNPAIHLDQALYVLGTTTLDGATNLGVYFGTGVYNSNSTYLGFVAGSYIDGQFNGTGNGALYAIARKSASPGIPPVNAPFVSLCGFDNGSLRFLDFGGGGWGAPDATLVRFWTAALYNELEDQALIRMSIGSNGQVIVGAGSIDTVGALRVADAVGGVSFRVSSTSPSRIGTGGLRVGTDANPTAGTMFDQGGAGGARFGRTALATGVAIGLLYVGAAHTNQTLSTEVIDVDLQNTGSLQHATGALTTQRTVRIQRRTYSFVAASTITNAATLAIENAPLAGTNATITSALAFWVQAGMTLLEGGLRLGADITPAAISTSQNNYAPTGIGDAAIIRQDVTAAAVSITGIATDGDGRYLMIANLSATNSLTLSHENASSTAANRFTCPNAANVIISPIGMAVLLYDTTTSRWRIASVT